MSAATTSPNRTFAASDSSAPQGVAPQGGGAERSQTGWTILQLLRWTTRHFEERGIESARLDAECLLAHALAVDRVRLYVEFEKPVDDAVRRVFRELVRRRANQRVPVAQLLGRKEFWSLSLRVTADVLTPRPDTETLVMAALELLPEVEAPARVLDVGTGSGAVALAIAVERPQVKLVATDVSQAALEIARQNAEECGVVERLRLLCGSVFEPVQGERFDLIVSNPPYVAESTRSNLPPELSHEPEQALFAGPDGLAVLGELVRGADAVLAPGAGLALELSPEQAPIVAGWCCEAGLVDVRQVRDLAGRLRVVTARRQTGTPVGRR